ncbi:MAG: UDP-glucose/GDP-mannose dehydrogenase family protein, partial [Verrucomicrobia bacterium]|nr:UDP-glucose/GDP-mannose dehydrogenase family protein [Verrucomicrobiota bacterium]
VPAGTCRALATKYPGRAFAYSPENLRLGKALEIFRQPDRVVVGARADDAETRRVLGALFAPFAADRIVWMSPESAEMTKHGINAFLALSVTFANEIARLCERVGADAREVEAGLKSESRIGPKAYLRPGGAFAGGTLARDVVALTQLAAANGERADLIAAILTSNDAHKNWALGRLRALLGASLAGAEIAVLGLTYKPGTDTLRRSGAVELAHALLKNGATVRAYDPAVRALPPELAGATFCATPADALRNADAAVIATEWPEIRAADWPALVPTMRRRVILDANRFLRDAAALGDIEYFAVGSAL